MACCIGLMLLASCKKNPVSPTINIYEGEGCVTENAQVYSGDEILVGFTGTGEHLTQIEIVLSQNGNVLASLSDNFRELQSEPATPFTYTHAFTVEAIGTVTIKGTVTDANGLTASKSFDIIYNEKPNAKFVGHYEGDALVTGSFDVDITGMDPIHQEMTDRPVPVILDLAEGDDMNKVKGTCKIGEREFSGVATVEGNSIKFATENEPFTFNFDFNGITLSPVINITSSITPTLSGNQLNLSGTCSGEGVFTYLVINGTITIDVTAISGSLTKMR